MLFLAKVESAILRVIEDLELSQRLDLPLFRIKDRRAGPATDVSQAAHRPAYTPIDSDVHR